MQVKPGDSWFGPRGVHRRCGLVPLELYPAPARSSENHGGAAGKRRALGAVLNLLQDFNQADTPDLRARGGARCAVAECRHGPVEP